MKLRAALLCALMALGVSIGLVAIVGPASPAWACSCVGGDPDERAELIVVGTITEVTEQGVRLAVEAVEKGSLRAGSVLSLRVGSSEAACGFPFSHGIRYRVPSSDGATSLCSGIRQVAAAPRPANALTPAASAATPEAGDPPDGGWLAAGAVLTLGVAGGLVALLLRRRRG